MKNIYLFMVLALVIQLVSAQNRIAEKVSFKSGEETITGILVKPNSGDNLPVVVFCKSVRVSLIKGVNDV